MFVPKFAVLKRKQLDRVKVNLALSLVRVKTNAYSAHNSISILRFCTSFRPDPNSKRNRKSSHLFATTTPSLGST